MMIRMVVVLPAPLGPTKPNIWPGSTANDDAVERDPVAEAPGQPAELEAAQATSAGSSRPWSRSRPRCTAAMNFDRLTSSVLRISSA